MKQRSSGMKYTYREEYFYGYTEDKASIAHVIVWSVFALLSTMVSPPLIFVFLGLAAVFGISGYVNANKRYKKAMKRRHKMMKEGYWCTGKIVAAGGGHDREREKYYDEEDKAWKVQYTRIPNYWVEVEYTDSKDGQVKRFKADKFGKKTGHLVGRKADAYVCNGLVYIDIP